MKKTTPKPRRDPATIIGLLLAFGALGAMVFLEGSSLTTLLLPAPMILVFGATIAVAIASTTIKDAIRAAKALPRALRGHTARNAQTVEDVVGLAERARRGGLLSLESEAAEASDPFLRDALQNIADGTDADDLRCLLEDEILTKASADKTAAKFYTTMGGYAPTIGIIGTVVALTHVLGELSTPEKLGPLIATAFVATLWGLLSANFLWLPIGERLNRLSALNVESMTLLMEGVLAIQAGAQPRLVEEKLHALTIDLPKAA